MDTTNLIQLLCLSIPIILMIGAIVLLVLFFIIRSVIRSARRKAGIPRGAGKLLGQQLKNIDKYLANDERQTAQWERDSQPLDISSHSGTNAIPDFSYEPDPIPQTQQPTEKPNCPACGAPSRPGSQICDYCGKKI